MTTNRIVARALGPVPRTLSDIAIATGLDRREVEAAVQELRLGGAPIASGDRGVWIAQSADELAASNQRLRNRLASQSRTARALRHTERRMRDAETHPLSLFGDVA